MIIELDSGRITQYSFFRQKYHVAQLHKGKSLYKIGYYQNALQCFDTILKSDPKHLDSLLNQGLTFQKMEKFPQAIVSLKKLLEIAIKEEIHYICIHFSLHQGFIDADN